MESGFWGPPLIRLSLLLVASIKEKSYCRGECSISKDNSWIKGRRKTEDGQNRKDEKSEEQNYCWSGQPPFTRRHVCVLIHDGCAEAPNDLKVSDDSATAGRLHKLPTCQLQGVRSRARSGGDLLVGKLRNVRSVACMFDGDCCDVATRV